ncbi:MAG: 30S ribosomal protein S8 [Candidatus Woykebacteria bacterium RIFCSPLOWO2_01_FULL_41_12]|uniref:Small ribosomal subunit protein uS8 n=2 Tax=Microgenomates group TaxID=1794810 RepID=A0A0H4T533_9BACT|nr:30S ribosomal protein S8, small subunit ribosomal protein S8 [uncultured Microgenomates bacterium Rifle_16ft_4_minimus_19697]OGY30572.1 MAG: 30S ribosomal protein S8 [Candidatus Woykebacteria bacterium RIFCSPLOWO2_01_FULL_41_12]
MDTIADTLTIIRNGYLSRKKTVVVRYSRQNKSITEKLAQLGYLALVQEEGNGKKTLRINLLYKDNKPVLEGIRRVSKSSVRVYAAATKIPRVLGGLGEVVLSTPKGILTGTEARNKGTGGEILFKVW